MALFPHAVGTATWNCRCEHVFTLVALVHAKFSKMR